jgi:hypothetical protein
MNPTKSYSTSIKPRSFVLNVFGLLIFLTFFASGCSKDELNKMVSDVKESAGEAVSQAKQVAKTAGNLTAATDMDGKGSMQLDVATEFSASYIRLVPIAGEAVLQIKNNTDDTETFPSFFIQGSVKAASLDGIVGKPVACRVFAQPVSRGDVWSNLNSEPIMVTVRKTDNKFSAKFESATLTNSASGATTSASGTFECVEF